MARVRTVAGHPGGLGQDGEQKSFTIVLEREQDTLGFNIIGGRPNQERSATGIYVSKILENGPADRADSLEIHDKIIEGIVGGCCCVCGSCTVLCGGDKVITVM